MTRSFSRAAIALSLTALGVFGLQGSARAQEEHQNGA